MDSLSKPTKFHPRYHRHNNGLYVPTSPGGGPTSYASVILADSPSVYATMTEPAGAIVDTMGGSTVQGSITQAYQTVRPGQVLPGVLFANNNSSAVRFSNAVPLDARLAVSWEMWIKDVSGGGYMILGCKDDSGGAEISFLIGIGGSGVSCNLGVTIKGSSNTGLGSGSNFSTAVPCHLVCTASSGTNPFISIYVNGVLNSTGQIFTDRRDSGIICAGASPDGFWTSAAFTMTDYAVYQQELTAGQVAAHFAARNLP